MRYITNHDLMPAIALLGLLTITGCQPAAEPGGLEVWVEGAAGETLYLESFSGRTPIRLDSTVLDKNGHGTLRLHQLPMDFYRITFDGYDQIVLALDSNTALQVKASAEAFYAPTSVSGSKHAERFFAFQRDAGGFEGERGRLRDLLAEKPGDPDLLDELNRVNNAFHDLCKRYASEDPTSPVAMSAVSRLDMGKEVELYRTVRNGLTPVMGRSGFFRKFKEQVDRVEQQEIAMRMQEEELRRLKTILPEGSLAPDIKQNTPEGGTFALSQMRGKVVYIDFWASWCRPCRIENPELKKVYEKHKGKGFDILGVSLDRDHAAWVEAIKADGLPWKHVSDLKFWSNEAALEYAVSSIPYGILVDREGKIVAKGIRSHDLDHRLMKML
ncbi:MAG: AhpC/TSA family protein [Flavobacteriales bacterium]|nr:AhpC/TSA family protein [Flavobacteriales bacterium]